MGVFDTLNKKKTPSTTGSGGVFSQINTKKESTNTPLADTSRPMTFPELKETIKTGKAVTDVVGKIGDKVGGQLKTAFDDARVRGKAVKTAKEDKKKSDKQKEKEYRENARKGFPAPLKWTLEQIDYLADKTKPAADIALELYTPGGGLSAVNALTKGAGFGVSKLAPGLANNALGRATKTALTEAAVGAPLGVSNVLARNPQATPREIAEGAAFGAGGGALLGGGGRLVGEGIKSGTKALTQAGLRPTIENASNIRGVINEAVGNEIPQNVRRTTSAERVPEIFPERYRRTFGTKGSTDIPASTTDEAIPSTFEQLNANKPRSSATVGERANYGTQVREGDFGEEFNQGVAARDRTYPVSTNAEQIAEANRRIADLPKAESDFLGNASPDANHVATGYRLLQELNRTKQTQRALNVADKLAADLTAMGQSVQAASIIKRLSPEGQLLHLQRTATKAGKTVSEADARVYTDLAQEVQQGTTRGADTSDFLDTLNRIKAGEQLTPEELEHAANILEDAKKFIKSGKQPTERLPKEMKDVRTRDKVTKYLNSAEEAALARIAARRNQLNALPLGEWADHAIVASAQIAKGTIKAATYVEDLVRLFGEEVRPYAKAIYTEGKKLLSSSSKRISEDKIDEANDIIDTFRFEQSENNKLEIMAARVKKLIEDSKNGNVNPEVITEIRELAEEIASVPSVKRVISPEKQFLQSVKSLAIKLSDEQTERIPKDQANREISSLIRQVSKLTDSGEKIVQEKLNNEAISNIAHDLLEQPRPTPKPKSVQEKVVEKFIKEREIKPGDIEKLRSLAKELNDLRGASAQKADMQMQAILNKYEKSSMWDRFQALRYIAMLFNTGTQSVNALSGPIMATSGYVADLAGAIIDMTYSAIKKTPRTTQAFGSNPLRFMAGWFKNIGTGAKAGWQGVNPSGIAGANDIRGLTYKSLFNPLGILERSLGAVAKGADYATYRTVMDSELRRQAGIAANAQKLKGADRKQFIEKFLVNPPDEAQEIADKIARRTTFQRTDTLGGKAANFLNSAPTGVKQAANIVFPFVRTPINIASAAVDLSPAGLIKGLVEIVRSGDDLVKRRDAIRTLGLSLVGGGLSATGYYLNQIGVLTGANDSGDRYVNEVREQAGKGKFRFNTSAMGRYLDAMLSGKGINGAEKAAKYQKGDQQFDYNKLQPIAFPFALGASLSENNGEVSKSAEDAAASLFGMSTLKGVQDIFSAPIGGTAGEKTTGIINRLAESFVKSFSPSLLAQEARRQDPIQRKVAYNEGLKKDIKEYFMSRTPGLSQKLPPKITSLGDTKKNAPGVMGQYINPYRSEEAAYNPVAVIISDLIERTGDKTLAPKPFDKTVSGRDENGQPVTELPIPQEMYQELQIKVGQLESQMIQKLPENLTDEQRAYMIKKVYDFVRSGAREYAKQQLGIVVN